MSNQLACLSLIAWLSVAALPQSENDPNAAIAQNTKIARVLDKIIYSSDIDPSQKRLEEYQKDHTPEQVNQWFKQNRKSTLSYYMSSLFEDYARQQGIEVTDADIEQFNSRMLQASRARDEQTKQRIEDLQKELQADNLDEKKRSDLTGQLELYTRAMAIPKPEGLFKGRNAPAEHMIRMWKIYNRLYDQYGGRVIFQQAGPEPFDALKRFFEDQQKKGRFEFYDKELEDAFWEYYRNEKIHTFYKDEDEAKRMMNTPWWAAEPKKDWRSDYMDYWGDCVDGLCMKIRMARQAFYPDQSGTIIVDLLNIGTDQFDCAPLEQFFEIELDGQWYKWSGPVHIDILTSPFEPKKARYDFAQIKLTEQWLSKQSGEPLKLTEGVHTLQLRFTPMDTIQNGELKRLAENFAVTSNKIKFEILPPRPPAKPRR